MIHNFSMEFSKTLINWYLQNKRDLPWRNVTNPYTIWLSEIILQQTRVAQGLPYFLRFTHAFPTVFDLANAEEEAILKLWQGLGYYSRARNLHHTAKHIVTNFNGVFPNTYLDLLQLKGVGQYTAAAIASFAYNENVPVVDGNVFRVLSRYFAIETDISSNASKSEFIQLANELLPKGEANIFNQAIMEFGALMCVPKNPNCLTCVLNESCLALKAKRVSDFPLKTKKSKVTHRYLNYIVFSDDINSTIIIKRTSKGIWYNLYEFPVIETSINESDQEIFNLIEKQQFVPNAIQEIKLHNLEQICHKLSHQHLFIRFWKVQVIGLLSNGISQEAASNYPFPIVLYNFIEKEWF